MKSLSINAVILSNIVKALSHLQNKTNKFNFTVDQTSQVPRSLMYIWLYFSHNFDNPLEPRLSASFIFFYHSMEFLLSQNNKTPILGKWEITT